MSTTSPYSPTSNPYRRSTDGDIGIMSLVMDLEVPRKLSTLSSLGSKTWINAWYFQLVSCSPVCNLVAVIGPGYRWRLAVVRYTIEGLVRPGSLDFCRVHLEISDPDRKRTDRKVIEGS